MAVHESNAVVKFTTWPPSGTTVANEGTGGASYAGTLAVNRYTTAPSGATANTFNASGDQLTVPKGAAINNLSAFTMEWLFKYATTTGSYEYLFYKGQMAIYTNSTGTTKTMNIWRKTTTMFSETELWTFSWTPTNGAWYDVQLSWGAVGTTPILKINNESQYLTHVSTGLGSWTDDSGYDLTLMGLSGGVYMIKGDYTIYRLHNTNLSSADLTDNYTEDWKRTSTTITISGANISAEASITGGALTNIITGPLIEARTYLVGGTLKKVVAGPSISAETAVVGGSITIIRQVVVGPTINAEASVAGGAFSTNILGSTIDAEASVLAWGIDRYIAGPEIDAEASIEIAENNLITTLIGELVEAEADIAGGSVAFYAASSEAVRITLFLNEFVNPYEESAVSENYRSEDVTVEDSCVVKYTLWPTTGITIENEMGDTDYDGTAVDNDYATLVNDATCFNFDAVTDNVSIHHGNSIDNINEFTEEFIFYIYDTPSPSGFISLVSRGTQQYYLGFYSGGGANGKVELYRENTGGSKWILCDTTTDVITGLGFYYVQLTWDASDYTNLPVLEVNNSQVSWDTVDNTMTGEDWYDDSGDDLYVFGDSSGAYGNIGPVILYRRHNRVLTDGELTSNFNSELWRLLFSPPEPNTQYEEEKQFINVDDVTDNLESELVADEVNDLTSDEYVGVEAVSLEDVILDVYELGEVPGAWETYNLRPLAIIETIELALVEEYELD